jgi:hypothetical protein
LSCHTYDAEQVLRHYNRSLGRPSPRMVERLRRACADILSVGTWPDFFVRLGLSHPGDEQLHARMRSAVENSRHKGYHRPAGLLAPRASASARQTPGWLARAMGY